jgi:hypothetical protein
MRMCGARVRDGFVRTFSSSLRGPLTTEGGTFKGIMIDNPGTNAQIFN